MGNPKTRPELELVDYKNFFEISTELICLVDQQNQIQHANPAFTRTIPQATNALEFFQIILPADLKEAQSNFQKVREEKVPVDFESRSTAADGSLKWFTWRVSLVPEKNLLYCVGRDITDSRAQCELKEKSARLLAYTVNSLPILVAYIDLDFKYQFMNSMYEAWVGDLAEKLKSGQLEQVVGHKSAQTLRHYREEAKRTGKPNRSEISFYNTLGEKRYLEVQYHPHHGTNGELEGLMVLGFDLTDTKRANQSIQNTENKLHRVLSDGKIGFWEMEVETRLVSLSDNTRLRLGLLDSKPVPMDQVAEFIHPDDRKKLAEAQNNLIEDQKPYEVEFRVRSPDNSYFWTFSTGNPILDPKGKLIGIMGISIDINRRKQLEQTLQEQQAKMIASSRLSALGEMAGGVAHEINNPLAIIQFSVESLKLNHDRGTLTSDFIEKTTDRIEGTVMRIAKIIQSLRSLCRDGEKDPCQPTPLKRIIDDALEICNQRFINHGISLIVEIPPTELYLSVRPTQISQVLLNLLNNAFDAVEKNHDERWIQISACERDDMVEISVTDNGNGIPAELHEKIFDPFFTTKEFSKGTGLGLSVSKTIIVSHGGTLQINPNFSKTQFQIRLPKPINYVAPQESTVLIQSRV